ncbi:MAG: site-specific integrase [Arcobacter butzleri]|nr:site-specific integrase [Aliarcobacter butzleri]
MNNNLICSDGSFYVRKDTNMIYVQGTVNGKHYKKSIGKKATPLNKKWIEKQNPMHVLLKLIGVNANEPQKTSFEKYGLRVLRSNSGVRGEETQKDYESIFYRLILPYFEKIVFHEISALDVTEFLSTLQSQHGYCYDRCIRIKRVLANILKSAFDDRLIPHSIMDMHLVQKFKFKPTPRNTKVYKVFETKQILNFSKGWLRVFLDISLKYGLRTGEIIGLKWSDFDLERGFFEIRRSISKGKIIEVSKVVHKNKNHDREIFLFPETIELLKSYTTFRPNDEWLFVTKDGKPFKNSKTVIDYHFRPFLNEIGVEYKTLSATRRTYVSMMKQSEKVALEDIQEIVGHVKGSKVTTIHYDLDCLEDIHKQKKAEEKSKIFNALLKIA